MWEAGSTLGRGAVMTAGTCGGSLQGLQGVPGYIVWAPSGTNYVRGQAVSSGCLHFFIYKMGMIIIPDILL